ncbi:MAG: ribosome small subunit-dependent GTPase [Bacteroidota bacterium]|jgi:ribosome biogenesis GTPase
MKGLVVRSTGSWYDIIGEDDIRYQGRLRGIFKNDDKKVTNPIAVGDYVTFEYQQQAEEKVTITEILPRNNYIIRKSTHKTAHDHIIAANIDQAVIIVTIDFPRTSIGFIDRFLVSAESYRIPVTIVINKVDLLIKTKHLEKKAELFDIYEPIGYPCIATSVVTGEGIAAFGQLFEGKKTLIAGHSGVGKSTLINCIAPNLDLKTGIISSFANKGKHTTTFAEMFEMRPGTFIIDTPGIKELGISEVENQELSHFFPEMRALLNQCKYHNCTHVHEPNCAVQNAINEGKIHISRFESYLGILAGDDNRK